MVCSNVGGIFVNNAGVVFFFVAQNPDSLTALCLIPFQSGE